MTRQTLRYPVGEQFRKILEDDHEWKVFTDLHLKVILARRGRKTSIPQQIILNAYRDLKWKVPEGKTLRIYDLHTHPTDTYIPSSSDINNFIGIKLWQNYGKPDNGIYVMGHGVITKKGIFIVKMPDNEERLNELYTKQLDKHYNESVKKHIENKLGVRGWEAANQKAKGLGMSIDDANHMLEKAYTTSFKELLQKEPSIGTKIVPRTHRFNMRRRR